MTAMRFEMQDVSFSYKSKPVLKNISFRVDERELLGIVGPNGSGKTTLLKCINSIVVPEGQVFLNDVDVKKMGQKEIAKVFSYVPQAIYHNSFPATVFDVVLLGRRPYLGWSVSPKDIKIVSEILSTLKLDELAMRNFNELSGGERQKVLIARALAQEPKILLLDEPTSNLDLKHQLEIMELLRRLAREKKLIVILVSHDLNLAARYCDRVVLLNSGRIYAVGKPDEVLTRENIRRIYGIEVEVSYDERIKACSIVPVRVANR
jgi:iron complex transport system ATP-binding protein